MPARLVSEVRLSELDRRVPAVIAVWHSEEPALPAVVQPSDPVPVPARMVVYSEDHTEMHGLVQCCVRHRVNDRLAVFARSEEDELRSAWSLAVHTAFRTDSVCTANILGCCMDTGCWDNTCLGSFAGRRVAMVPYVSSPFQSGSLGLSSIVDPCRSCPLPRTPGFR